MRRNPLLRWAALAAMFVLTTGGGCGSDTINVTSTVQPTPNAPPTIVSQGPQYAQTPIELVIHQNPPTLYFLVADPNGLDDISVALLSIDTILVRRIIARPATLSPCRTLTFTDNDTVALGLPFPIPLPRLENCALTPSAGGYFTFSSPFAIHDYVYGCRTLPSVMELSESFSQITSGCTNQGPHYAVLVFNRPAGAPLDIFVTALEAEFRGISVTVYDGAGASAVATFPNLRLVYTSREEKATAP